MNNKGIIEYKESFISKIKKYFKNLFKNKKEENNYVTEISKKMIMLQKYLILMIQKLIQTKKKANFLMI